MPLIYLNFPDNLSNIRGISILSRGFDREIYRMTGLQLAIELDELTGAEAADS